MGQRNKKPPSDWTRAFSICGQKFRGTKINGTP
jgi:hypothetical protein